MFIEGYQFNQCADTILNHIQYALIEQMIHKFHHFISYIYGNYFHHIAMISTSWQIMSKWRLECFQFISADFCLRKDPFDYLHIYAAFITTGYNGFYIFVPGGDCIPTKFVWDNGTYVITPYSACGVNYSTTP